jgi:hypothetical protein
VPLSGSKYDTIKSANEKNPKKLYFHMKENHILEDYRLEPMNMLEDYTGSYQVRKIWKRVVQNLSLYNEYIWRSRYTDLEMGGITN